MAEGGKDPLDPMATRAGANMSLPLDITASDTTPPDSPSSSLDSFFNRVTPPDGHSRMCEFRNVERGLVVNATDDEVSLKSLNCAVDAGPANLTAKKSISDHTHRFASDAISSITSRGAYMTQRSLSSSSDECTRHEGETIKYVCLSCNYALLCQVCVTLCHTKCQNYKFINDVVNDPEFGFENRCASFEGSLQSMNQQIKGNLSTLNTNTNLVACMKQRAISDLKKHRELLNKRFDKLESDFENKVTDIEKDEYRKIGTLYSEMVDLEKEFKALTTDFKNRKEEGKRSKIFTRIQWSSDDVDSLKQRLDEVRCKNEVFRYRYNPSEIMDKLLQDDVTIADVTEADNRIQSDITNVSTISVSHSQDTNNNCKITSIALLADRYLVAVDCNNSAIKIIDREQESLTAVYDMPSQPLDVAVIPGGQQTNSPQVLVSFPKDCTIGFFDGDVTKFTKIKTISTNGNCRSVEHCEGKLIVTFPNQGKIEIINTHGTLLKRITNETIGRADFRPQFVAMDTSRSRLYVSDRETHGVMILDNDGVVQNQYTSVDMIEPRGICVSNTCAVYVCSLSQHQVHQLSDRGDFIAKIDVKTDDQLAPHPLSVTYCNSRNILYVGQLSYNCIKAYKIGM